jgi:hypothetical protein
MDKIEFIQAAESISKALASTIVEQCKDCKDKEMCLSNPVKMSTTVANWVSVVRKHPELVSSMTVVKLGEELHTMNIRENM